MRKTLLLLALVALAGYAGAANFSEPVHKAHVNEYVTGKDCFACHTAKDLTIVPSLDTCKTCHDAKFMDAATFSGTKTHGALWGFDHGPAAKRDAKECAICHHEGNLKGPVGCTACHEVGSAHEQSDFGSNMTNVHRGEFKVSHPIAARTNPTLCSKCHQATYCSDCHDQFQPEELSVLSHRKGFSSIEVSGTPHSTFAPDSCVTCHPNSVTASHDWSRSHAREARKNLASCQACHPEGDVCLQCHSAKSGLGVNPHPEGWSDIKGNLRRASDGKTCRKCH